MSPTTPTHPGHPIATAARVLLRQLSRPSAATVSKPLRDPVDHLLQRQEILSRSWQRLRTAEQRGWTLAAARLAAELFRQAELVRQGLDALPAAADPGKAIESELSLRCLIDDLGQLTEELDGVEFRLREHKIVAHTDPIVLDDVHLGAFAIELNLDRLSRQSDGSCFRCVALDPNPASSNDSVTHPHVKDGGLCTGEATVPLATALRQGRICDAFCLVRSVLGTYNPHSPYVPLDDWDGVRCSDCDGLTTRDDLYYCETCGHDVCQECRAACDCCGDGGCRGCLERDPVSGRDCCPSCRHTCCDCGRTVDADEFDTRSEHCPRCHQRQQAEPITPSTASDLTPPEQENPDAELIELPEEGAGERQAA